MKIVKTIMNFLQVLAILLLAPSVLSAETNMLERLHHPNTNALVAHINSVTVLAFNTDRSVREARVLVNGTVVQSTGGGEGSGKGLKVAVVPAAKTIAIHLQVGPSMGWLLNADYTRPILANLYEGETYGPGKDLVLSEWTEVYSRTHMLNGKVTYQLSVEVK